MSLRYYLAPLEGITGYVYRKAYHEMFPDFDKYFTPFIATKQDKNMSAKEIRDIEPENNPGMAVVPQLLGNRGADVCRTAAQIAAYGYREINLNLGCPSGTVVPKKKGAGLLGEPVMLKAMLDELFRRVGKEAEALRTEQCRSEIEPGMNLSMDMEISVKTRLGMNDPEEFAELLELYNQYPLKELIIHARVREDYYRNQPNWDAFGRAMEASACPVVYNGDLFRAEDVHTFRETFPQADAVMLGRGVIANPALLREIQGGEKLSAKELQKFSLCLAERYREVASGERDVLFKMKELWNFFSWNFEQPEKCLKLVRKAQKLREYEDAVRKICREAVWSR